jgi:hypothetical protein
MGRGQKVAWSPVAASNFRRIKKKLLPGLQEELDSQVREILKNPLAGDPKKGALAGVRVRKFTYQGQLYLIAYEMRPKAREIWLLAFGTHEKFYEGLHRYRR